MKMTRTNHLIGEQHKSLNTQCSKRDSHAIQRNVNTDNWPSSSKISNQLTGQQDHTVGVQNQHLITNEYDDDERRINMEQQIGIISMQMPSMITKRGALECLSRGNDETMPDRLLGNGRGGSGRLMGHTNRGPLLRPSRVLFGGGGGRLSGSRNLAATFVAGLLYQIVIVSLILHKFPALVEPTRTTTAEASPSSSGGTQTLDRFTGSTNNLHSSDSSSSDSSPNQQKRLHDNFIEMSLIYTNELALNSEDGIDRRPQMRQRQHKTSEPQRQQQSPLKLTDYQTKDTKSLDTTTYDGDQQEGENNRRRPNQSSARSFMKSGTPSEGQLGGVVQTSALVEARQQSRATTEQPYKRGRRHAGLVDESHSDGKLDGDVSEVLVDPSVGLSTGEGPATTTPDCRKLATLWLYLHSSYPMLASHLIELGMGAKESQLARSINHLLENAERLIASAAAGSRVGQRLPPAWLTRVSAHPAYGKLVQALRAKQLDKSNYLHNNLHQSNRHQNHQQPALSEFPKDVFPAYGQDTANSMSSTEVLANTDGDQMSSSMSQMAPSREAYGRIVHYPHEIGSTDNSNGMARTRDKLRLLKHQQQHNQRQQAVRSYGNIVELNKISQSAAPSETDRHRLTESVINQARNNLVYGTVLLQPHGADNDQELDGNNNHRQSPTTTFNHNKPISTLRELAYESERQRLAQLNGRQLPALQLETSSKTTGNDQSPPVSSQQSYGHILTSPPNDNRGLSGGNNINFHDNIDKTEQTRQSEIAAADELTNQQTYGRTAAEDGDGDEFEGEFHSGPLKQVEIRMLRSLDRQQDKRKPHTTSGSAGEPLQQSAISTFGAATEIVID